MKRLKVRAEDGTVHEISSEGVGWNFPEQIAWYAQSLGEEMITLTKQELLDLAQELLAEGVRIAPTCDGPEDVDGVAAHVFLMKKGLA